MRCHESIKGFRDGFVASRGHENVTRKTCFEENDAVKNRFLMSVRALMWPTDDAAFTAALPIQHRSNRIYYRSIWIIRK